MKVDREGRQFIAMHDARGALVSANVSLSTGTAGTLIAGDADHFLDIVEVTFSHSTTVAGGTADVSLVNDGTTVRTFTVGGGTTQFVFDAPLKQITKNTPWIVDMADLTGSTVAIGATLIRKQM